MFKKIFGVILVLIGLPLTLLYGMWPLTGNHGAEWLEFLPILSITGGMVVLGIYLINHKSKEQCAESESNEKI